MKPAAILTAVAALAFSACQYEVPLVAEHTIPIDPAVIGLWEAVPEGVKKPDADKRMLILKFSDTEYLVRHPLGKEGIHYRAYPIELGGKSCVQLEAIGTEAGPLDWEGDVATPFQVVSYETSDGKLEIRTLNSDLLGKDLKTTKALQEAFLKHKDSNELFNDPENYVKVVE